MSQTNQMLNQMLPEKQRMEMLEQMLNSVINQTSKNKNGQDILRSVVKQLLKKNNLTNDLSLSSSNAEDLLAMIKQVNPELVWPVISNVLLKLGLSDNVVELLEKKITEEGSLDVDTVFKMAQYLQTYDADFVLKLLKSLDLQTLLKLLQYKSVDLEVIQKILANGIPDLSSLAELL
jgi:hypothetical protein